MIRIPGGGRFEMRLADGSANPYIMAAALLEAGLDGVEHHRHPGPPLSSNAYHDRVPEGMRSLPDNLLDSLRALERDTILTAGLGEDFTQSYLKLKHAEWRDFSSYVTKWETDNTLDC